MSEKRPPKSKPCILCGRRHDHVQMECPPIYEGDYEERALGKDWRYPSITEPAERKEGESYE